MTTDRKPTSLVPDPQASRGPEVELITPTPLEVFREVGRRFNGTASFFFVFFGPVQMRGHHQGRALRVAWWGEKVHVEMPAPVGASLRIDQAPTWRRWLFSETLRTSGDSRHLIDPAMALFTRFGLTRFEVEQGQLKATGAPGLTATRIVAMVHALHDLVWRDPNARGRPRPVEEERPSVAGTRCPFCHDDLAEDAPVVNCATCDAPHHPSCFEEGHGCSIAGCAQSRARGRKAQ